MVAEYLNLDELRSIDDLSNYKKSLASDVKAWEEEYRGIPLPEEIRPDYAKHGELIEQIDGRVVELSKRHKFLASLDEGHQERTEEAFRIPTIMKKRDRADIWEISRTTDPADLNERARYAIEELRPVSWVDRAEAQGHIAERLGDDGIVAQHILLHNSPVYRSAWLKVLRAGMGGFPTLNSVETHAFSEAQRAMSLTGSAGGFGVPVDLDPTLLPTSNGVVNPIRSVARIVQTTVDTWRGVTSGAITASYATEATETTDNSPTLAQPEISTEKAQAFVPMSIEISMDWPSIRDEIGGLLTDAKDVLEASKFISGTGTNEPAGVITGTTNTVNAATGADAFTLANVYALRAALPPRYRARAVFMGNLLILDRVRQFETSTGGTASGSVWVDTLQDDTPARLFGRPVYEASEMATAATTGLKFLLYGDFSRFVIVDRVGLQVDFIPHLFGANQRPTGQRGLYAFWRNGSKVVDANAFRVLLGTA